MFSFACYDLSDFFFRKGTSNYDLEFGTKIFDDEIIKTGDSEFDIHESVLKLGLQTDDIKRHSITSNGAYLSMLMLRHLQIKEYQQMVCQLSNDYKNLFISLVVVYLSSCYVFSFSVWIR